MGLPEGDPCPCGKRSYPSWRTAKESARVSRKFKDVRGTRRPPITVYRCPDGGIHLTSTKDRDRLDKPKRGRRKRGR